MVEMIGLVTLCTLVWVLASSMARESDAEKRPVQLSSVERLTLAVSEQLLL